MKNLLVQFSNTDKEVDVLLKSALPYIAIDGYGYQEDMFHLGAHIITFLRDYVTRSTLKTTLLGETLPYLLVNGNCYRDDADALANRIVKALAKIR